MRQEAAWWVSVGAVTVLGIVFLTVARSAATMAEYPPIQAGAKRARRVLVWALVAATVVVLAMSLSRLPYPVADTPADLQLVKVTGHQWAWEIAPHEVVTGRPVEFQVTSADVNHGFAIYDSTMRLVAQVQAMPGYQNRLRYTFQRAGRYTILCLEYCGLLHHGMRVDISATAGSVAIAAPTEAANAR